MCWLDWRAMTPEFAAVYLAAMIDGEGCVSVSNDTKGGRKYSNRQVSIANTDIDIIVTCVAALQVLGIECWLSEREPSGNNPKGIIQIFVSHRHGFEQIAKLVPIQSERKREKLEDILASYNPRYKHFDRSKRRAA